MKPPRSLTHMVGRFLQVEAAGREAGQMPYLGHGRLVYGLALEGQYFSRCPVGYLVSAAARSPGTVCGCSGSSE